MSNDINRVIIGGRVVRDPIINQVNTQNGQISVMKFSIANQTFRETESSYFDCVTWGKRADIFFERLKKGTPILVEGELRQDRWKDKNTGENRSKIIINVSNLFVLSYDKGSYQKNNEYEKPYNQNTKTIDDIPVKNADDIDAESLGNFPDSDLFSGPNDYEGDDNNYFK